jgi:hypothetical protein
MINLIGSTAKPKRTILDVIKETPVMSDSHITEELNMFQQAKADDQEVERQRELDNQINLLISPKNYQRLRAFGFEVIPTGKYLGPSTTDRRSL